MAVSNASMPSLSILRSGQEMTAMRRAADEARLRAMRNTVCSFGAADGMRQIHTVYGLSIADPRFAVRLANDADFRREVDACLWPAPTRPPMPRHAVIARVGFGGGCRSRA